MENKTPATASEYEINKINKKISTLESELEDLRKLRDDIITNRQKNCPHDFKTLTFFGDGFIDKCGLCGKIQHFRFEKI